MPKEREANHTDPIDTRMGAAGADGLYREREAMERRVGQRLTEDFAHSALPLSLFFRSEAGCPRRTHL